MEWVSIKEKLPPMSYERIPFVLAWHTVHGVGVAWFHMMDADMISELEEDFKDKYLCSCLFVHSKVDGNYCIDQEEDDDIFVNGPLFKNLGMVTHWMPLPEQPI